MEHRSFETDIGLLEKRMRRVEKYMLWSSIIGTARFVLILIPLVLAIVYVPPFIRDHLPFLQTIEREMTQLHARSIR